MTMLVVCSAIQMVSQSQSFHITKSVSAEYNIMTASNGWLLACVCAQVTESLPAQRRIQRNRGKSKLVQPHQASLRFSLLTIIISSERQPETNRVRKKRKLSSLPSRHMSRALSPSSMEMDSNSDNPTRWAVIESLSSSEISLKHSPIFKCFPTQCGSCGWRSSCTYHSVYEGTIHRSPNFGMRAQWQSTWFC